MASRAQLSVRPANNLKAEIQRILCRSALLEISPHFPHKTKQNKQKRRKKEKKKARENVFSVTMEYYHREHVPLPCTSLKSLQKQKPQGLQHLTEVDAHTILYNIMPWRTRSSPLMGENSEVLSSFPITMTIIITSAISIRINISTTARRATTKQGRHTRAR